MMHQTSRRTSSSSRMPERITTSANLRVDRQKLNDSLIAGEENAKNAKNKDDKKNCLI